MRGSNEPVDQYGLQMPISSGLPSGSCFSNRPFTDISIRLQPTKTSFFSIKKTIHYPVLSTDRRVDSSDGLGQHYRLAAIPSWQFDKSGSFEKIHFASDTLESIFSADMKPGASVRPDQNGS